MVDAELITAAEFEAAEILIAEQIVTLEMAEAGLAALQIPQRFVYLKRFLVTAGAFIYALQFALAVGYDLEEPCKSLNCNPQCKGEDCDDGKKNEEYLYHYTDREGATGIVNDKTMKVTEKYISKSGITFPPGAYATTIQPTSTEYTQRELSALFFGGEY